MAKFSFTKGSTSLILNVFIQDSSATDGSGLGSLTQSSSIVGGYVRMGGTGVALAVDEDVTTEGTYQAPSTAAQVRIGTPANMRTGTYELHFHNDLFASGADTVTITLGGASNMAELPLEIQLTSFDLNSAGVDVTSISGDSDAADNLELQYDETGLTGDTFPSNQSQINQIANVSGIAKRAAESYVLTTGTQSANTVSATEELDGVRHEHTDTAGAMDLYYQFNIGPGLATEIKVTGYLQGNNDNLEVYGYDWVSDSWKQIGIMEGQASSTNVVNAYDLLVDMVGSGANSGTVRVRFTDGAFTLTTATLAIDQILVEFAQGVEGYEGGAVWLDTNASNTNTVRGVDGVASNPVSTIAAVNTLLASTNLARVEVAPQSSFTLSASQENQQFMGKNWTLALGGQSVSGSFFDGASITGIGTGAAEVHFDHCHFGDVTLPPCDAENSVLEGIFTIGSAGDFFFENCKSGVAGTSTPVMDFGALLNASNVNFRVYSGGIEVQNMGEGTGSYNMSLEGWGQLIIAASCSATSTIAIRGNFGPITDNAGGAVTVVDTARFESTQLVDDILDEVNTGAEHNVVNSLGRQIREQSEQIGYQDGAIWIDTVNGTSGSVVGENGKVNAPVDNITDALSLAVSIGIVRMHVASGSSITLLAALEGYEIFNANWTLILNGQSISGSCIHGATVTGIATGANAPKFIDCQFGAVTLPASLFISCGIGNGGGTFTGGALGEFIFHHCFSLVPGSGAPAFVFTGLGASTGIHNRSWGGGATYTLDADCTLSHEVLAGGGTTITTGGADVEVRGITRSLTIIASAAETVQFVGTTGPITLSGTTTATINLYGVSASLSDTTSAATVTDRTVSRPNVNTEVDTAFADYDGPTNTEMEARTLVSASYGTSANQTTILNRIGAWTGTGINTLLGAFKALLSKSASAPSDIGGTFNPSNDSTEAIRDRGDAAWTAADVSALATAAAQVKIQAAVYDSITESSEVLTLSNGTTQDVSTGNARTTVEL